MTEKERMFNVSSRDLEEKFLGSMVTILLCPSCGDSGVMGACHVCDSPLSQGHLYEPLGQGPRRLVYHQEYEKAFKHWLETWEEVIKEEHGS